MGGTRYPRSKVSLGHGRGWLTKESAASIFRIDRQIGHPLQITEAGRDWAEQNKHYQHYLKYGYPIALNPNTPSVHQKGDAADSNEAQRILAIMTDHGWIRTVYRWVNGKWTLVESWHFEHFIERDNRRNDPAPSGEGETPNPIEEEEEEDDMPRNTGIIYNAPAGKPASQQRQVLKLHNTGSGFEFNVSTSLGNVFPAADLNRYAKTYDTTDFLLVSEDAAAAISEGLAQVRERR